MDAVNLKRKWIEALRSGQYAQIYDVGWREVEPRKVGYCAVGLLMHLSGFDCGVSDRKGEHPPDAVRQHLEKLYKLFGEALLCRVALDWGSETGRLTFVEIAARLEEEL